jgi:hypothetical protein
MYVENCKFSLDSRVALVRSRPFLVGFNASVKTEDRLIITFLLQVHEFEKGKLLFKLYSDHLDGCSVLKRIM